MVLAPLGRLPFRPCSEPAHAAIGAKNCDAIEGPPLPPDALEEGGKPLFQDEPVTTLVHSSTRPSKKPPQPPVHADGGEAMMDMLRILEMQPEPVVPRPPGSQASRPVPS